MKAKIQVGIEQYSGKTRRARLTPIDRTVDVSDDVGGILLLFAGAADSQDIQPGDGEVDISLGIGSGNIAAIKSNPFLAEYFDILKPFIREGWNLFIRLSPV